MIAVKHCLPMLLLVLCGCSLVHPYATKELYVLPAPELERVPSARPTAIRLGRAQIAPPFDSRMLQYRIGEAIYEPAYYAQWAAEPGSLIASSVSRSITSTGAFVVLDESTGADAPLLQLHVTDLYADVREHGKSLAIMAVRATLLNRRGEVLLMRDFRSEHICTSEQPADIIDAWAIGVGDTVRLLVPELQGALNHGGHESPPAR